MAKLQGNRKPAKRAGDEEKRLILTRRGGHIREYGASLKCYKYQKDRLRTLANRGVPVGRSKEDGHVIYRPCSMNYYLNYLLWKDEL